MLKACPTSPQHLVYTRQACAVLLTGIGVKLAIYNPFSSPDAPSQRKLFSVSISVCFGLQLVMRRCTRAPCSSTTRPGSSGRAGALVVLLRLCTVGAMLGLLAAPLSPALFVVAQALLALLENHLPSAEPKHLEDEEDAAPASPAARTPRSSTPALGTFSEPHARALPAPHAPRTSRAAPRASAASSSTGARPTCRKVQQAARAAPARAQLDRASRRRRRDGRSQGAAADQTEPIGWRGVDRAAWSATAVVAQAWEDE